MTDEQRAVVDFLADSRSYPHGVTRVERIDTHCSIVFLAGDKAYKLKRAVRLPYLDYGTVERRRQMCESELALNRRTAPDLYEAVMPVVRGRNGALSLGGDGEAVDWLVVMRRFAEADVLSRMAERGTLTDRLMETLADTVAAFHAKAAPSSERGGVKAMASVFDSNRQAFEGCDSTVLESADVARLDAALRRALDHHAALIEARRRHGKVRQCHGDLHLRNIVMLDGRPAPFDGVEFDDALIWTDVLYDLAFLLMDLDHRGHRDFANIVLNRYFADTDEWDGVALLPMFLACRAAIRAHVSAVAATVQADRRRAEALIADARSYVRHALEVLAPPPARLIAVGGLSGTGKSTLARALAPVHGASPGALVLRSDVIRKRLFGVSPTAPLGPDAYGPEVNERVYARILELARVTLRSGHSVVADAVFARAGERDAIATVAREAGAPFAGLWLEAPLTELERRIEGRRDDASDATVEVVRRQRALDCGAVRWHRIDATGPVAEVLERARGRIEADAAAR